MYPQAYRKIHGRKQEIVPALEDSDLALPFYHGLQAGMLMKQSIMNLDHRFLRWAVLRGLGQYSTDSG
jgi:hypothetical protein